MFDVFGAIKMAAGPLFSIAKGWQKRKTVKLEGDIAIAKAVTDARVDKIKTGQAADIAWEKTSLDQSGWKDEYWTIILSIPMVMCFIPGLVIYVERGFEVLQETPEWYRYVIGIAIGSAFGVRSVANFMKLKKGN
jgi:hypothetical protein